MFERSSNSGHTVNWQPSNPDLAADALATVSGTGVPTKSEAKDSARVDLGNDKQLADSVKEEYRSLCEDAGVEP